MYVAEDQNDHDAMIRALTLATLQVEVLKVEADEESGEGPFRVLQVLKTKVVRGGLRVIVR